MNGFYQSSHGLLLVGVTSTLEFFFGQDFPDLFHELHPEYKVIINERSHIDCETEVAIGEMVAALTYGESGKKGVNTIHLMRRQRVCLVPRESPLAQREVIHISDLRGYRIVSSINNFSLNRLYKSCQDRGFQPEVYRVDDITTMLNFCCERGYIGITIDYLLLRSSFWKMNLIALPIAPDEFDCPINLLVNEEAYRRKIVQEVVTFIEQTVLKKKDILPEYPFTFHE